MSVVDKMYCNRCQKEFDADMMFCDECGMRLSSNANFNNEESCIDDGRLMEIAMASIYRGNTSIGTPIFAGTIYIYADRIERKAMLGDIRDVFVKMEDIVEVDKGNYMLVWSSLILKLSNGDVYTLSGATTGTETINRAYKIINDNIVQAAVDNE